MGFWIESPLDGRITPDEKIHPRYHGRPSASSYNFVLNNLYYTFYKILYVLEEAILEHFRDVYDINLMFNNDYPNKNNDKTCEYWRELNTMMKRLPRIYFPNEFGKQTFNFEENDNKLVFTRHSGVRIVLLINFPDIDSAT